MIIHPIYDDRSIKLVLKRVKYLNYYHIDIFLNETITLLVQMSEIQLKLFAHFQDHLMKKIIVIRTLIYSTL